MQVVSSLYNEKFSNEIIEVESGTWLNINSVLAEF